MHILVIFVEQYILYYEGEKVLDSYVIHCTPSDLRVPFGNSCITDNIIR